MSPSEVEGVSKFVVNNGGYPRNISQSFYDYFFRLVTVGVNYNVGFWVVANKVI